MPNVMAAQPNIGGALCESSVIQFFVPRYKVWLTYAAGVPCSNAANIGEGKIWTQSELCTWQNSARRQCPHLLRRAAITKSHRTLRSSLRVVTIGCRIPNHSTKREQLVCFLKFLVNRYTFWRRNRMVPSCHRNCSCVSKRVAEPQYSVPCLHCAGALCLDAVLVTSCGFRRHVIDSH